MLNDSKIIDLSYLKDASANNQAFMKEMMGIFLTQTPIFLSQLNEYAEQSSWAEFRAVMHKFKPTVTMMGITKGDDIVKEIEVIVKTQTNLDQVKNKLKILSELCSLAYIEINNEITLLQ